MPILTRTQLSKLGNSELLDYAVEMGNINARLEAIDIKMTERVELIEK